MKRKRRLFAGLLVIPMVVGAVLMLIPDLELRGVRDDYASIDLAHLIDCAARSNASYHSPGQIREEYGSEVTVGDFPESGVRIFYDGNRSGDRQWLVIRGTANLENTLADLDFIEGEDHELGLSVHRGFDEAQNECLPWVIEQVDRNRPVCITGHSLGGSVAVLLAAIFDHRGYQDVSAVTFGQPKLTNGHGARMLKHLRVLRVVYDDDPVPLVPPVLVGSEDSDIYHHFGAEMVLREDGHFFLLKSHDPDRLDVADFWSNLTHLRVKSHLLGNSYLPSLKLAMVRSDGDPVQD